MTIMLQLSWNVDLLFTLKVFNEVSHTQATDKQVFLYQAPDLVLIFPFWWGNLFYPGSVSLWEDGRWQTCPELAITVFAVPSTPQ